MSGFTTSHSAQPTIWTGPGKAHVNTIEAIAALVRAGRDIFSRGTQLVSPCRVAARGANGAAIATPGVLAITRRWLQWELAQVAEWRRRNDNGEERAVDPPEIVVSQLLETVPTWTFPALAGVTSTPFLRRDGNVVARDGYDAASGYWLMGVPSMPPIPTHPTKDDARRALQEIDNLLTEFPFARTPGNKAVGLSVLLTPVLRPTLDGWAPLHSLTSPEPGTGKSYLLDLASTLATGNWCPVVAATRAPEELDKKLTAALLAGLPIISIDNVNRLLTSDLLAQAVERPMLMLRPLGTSQNILIPNITTIVVNGNNLTVADDLVRRTLQAELDADCEAPEQRTFKSDPVAMVRQDRGRYLAACLTVARAYMSAGYPERPAPLPSFQSWSDLVRGLLIWLDAGDPVTSISRTRDDDPHRQVFRSFVEHFPTGAYTAAELIDHATAGDGAGGLLYPDFNAALREVAKDRRGNLSTETLGYWLRSQKGRRTGPHKLSQKGNTKRREWLIETRTGSDSSDSIDDSSCYARGRVNGELPPGTDQNIATMTPIATPTAGDGSDRGDSSDVLVGSTPELPDDEAAL